MAIKKVLFMGLVLMPLFFSKVAAASYTLVFLPADTYSGKSITGSLTATFTDVGAGRVELTITSFLGDNESVADSNGLYFNFNPAKDNILKALHFKLVSDSKKFSQAAGVKLSADGYKAANGGLYDIELTWPSNVKAFSYGESQEYLITDSSGVIKASDFLYLSSQRGAGHTWLAAVDVNVSGKTLTGSWVGATDPPPGAGTPLPGAVWLFGSGLAVMVCLKKKFLG
ncbi:MAG TPA: hypothetical protein VEF34_03895 [Syntrophobacteraceae bacterium]|nr:hypothetical protein [Syntrophobacteraceae bacterium]